MRRIILFGSCPKSILRNGKTLQLRLINSLISIFPVLIIGLCLEACSVDDKKGEFCGLVLTVDDGYVQEWYEYLDFLQSFDSKMSFYISNFSSLSSEEKIKLARIDSMGHEIAFHGSNHVILNDYLLEHSIEDYIKYEIEEGLSEMAEDGYEIKHFAYPYGRSISEVNSILKEYFVSIRKVAMISDRKSLKREKNIYYDLPIKEQFIKGAGIDNFYNVPIDNICEALDKAQIQNKVLMLYCHRLSDEPGEWNIPIQKLEAIVTYCYQNEIPMMTLSEAFEMSSK